MKALEEKVGSCNESLAEVLAKLDQSELYGMLVLSIQL